MTFASRLKLSALLTFACISTFCISTVGVAAGPVVEVTVDGDKRTGQIVAHNDSVCFIVSGDGRLHGLEVRKVDRFRKLGARLAVDNAVKVRGQLQKELGRDYAVMSTGRYVVAASPATVKAHLATFDAIGRTFTAYFAKRKIPLEDPQFPLVAIVFADEPEFIRYAVDEGVPASKGLAGYYLKSSNRVAAFDRPGRTAVQQDPVRVGTLFPNSARPASLPLRFHESTSLRVPLRLRADDPVASVSAGVRDTIVHEATHQMAFNTGLHHRIGSDPKWVVEGLATLFEPDAVRKNVASRSVATRINEERLQWFRQRVEPKWQSQRLVELISDDRAFDRSPLDAYAIAWSLTFYLNETQPANYARLLRVLKDRDPLTDYTADERLTDFRSIFGRDLARFEVGMLRFINQLP